jgi:hypothetical protein
MKCINVFKYKETSICFETNYFKYISFFTYISPIRVCASLCVRMVLQNVCQDDSETQKTERCWTALMSRAVQEEYIDTNTRINSAGIQILVAKANDLWRTSYNPVFC